MNRIQQIARAHVDSEGYAHQTEVEAALREAVEEAKIAVRRQHDCYSTCERDECEFDERCKQRTGIAQRFRCARRATANGFCYQHQPGYMARKHPDLPPDWGKVDGKVFDPDSDARKQAAFNEAARELRGWIKRASVVGLLRDYGYSISALGIETSCAALDAADRALRGEG